MLGSQLCKIFYCGMDYIYNYELLYINSMYRGIYTAKLLRFLRIPIQLQLRKITKHRADFRRNWCCLAGLMDDPFSSHAVRCEFESREEYIQVVVPPNVQSRRESNPRRRKRCVINYTDTNSFPSRCGVNVAWYSTTPLNRLKRQ